jgi:hypothetical protein
MASRMRLTAEFAADLLARQHFAGPLQEHTEHLKGLGIQPDSNPLPAKLSGGSVHFKRSEAKAPGWG